MNKDKEKKGYRLAALLFSFSGLIYAIAGNITIGMMFFCLGMMYLAISGRKTEGESQKSKTRKASDRADPGDA